MHYLFASKARRPRKLVATFDSEAQLLSYVNWATLGKNSNGTSKFEQGSVLASFETWEKATVSESDDSESVVHNPSPSML